MSNTDHLASSLGSAGSNVSFAEQVTIDQPELVSVGDDVFFNVGVHIEPCGEQITIGSKTHFAPFGVLYGPLEVGSKVAVAAHVVLASVGHTYADPDLAFVDQPARKRKIVIEDNVWIGANAVVIQGVRIGTGSIIGAGSVVTRDVPPYSVVAGTPGRVIRKRK